jgi:hypothetical protein
MSQEIGSSQNDDGEMYVSHYTMLILQCRNEKDVMRILVATDNHLGYMERDRVRREDSFVTVEEILAVAKDKNV